MSSTIHSYTGRPFLLCLTRVSLFLSLCSVPYLREFDSSGGLNEGNIDVYQSTPLLDSNVCVDNKEPVHLVIINMS